MWPRGGAGTCVRLAPVPPSDPPALSDAQREALAAMLAAIPVVDELGELFAHAGHDLALVGGSVRDALLGRIGHDLDFATSARPDEILRITKQWRDSQWETGIAFGTVGLLKHGVPARGHDVSLRDLRRQFAQAGGRSTATHLVEDLRRRDFAVNAMAVSVPDHVFHDPFGGAADAAAQAAADAGLAQRTRSPTTRCG